MDYYGFYTGNNFDAYEYLGAHLTERGVVFRVFAPNAKHIQVIGDFNNWQGTEMNRIYDGNFWEVEVEGVQPDTLYKYKIFKADNTCMDHCDPYGFGMELRPNSASVIRDLGKHTWNDERWMKERTDGKDSAINIYEIHMGSWRKKTEGETDWYTYVEMADQLIPYLKRSGYNYVEIMPLSEHPCDESWGYQNTGFFSPTSRYGNAGELMEFVDKCHKQGIGVIMDFVPVHFALDNYALINFDGTALYEYPHSDVGVSEWGSCNFMHSRGEVRSFLQSAADYWLSVYHFDGLRMDAISNLIYWQGNPARGENKSAIDFIKCMNDGLKRLHPTIMLTAEDSTAYEGVTKPVSCGGLGFDYKWDMGWMNDTLEYFKVGPEERRRDYHKLTFSMSYFYCDRFLLPFSHDEVVHGKATIIQKMYGLYEDKFLQARALYLYMYAHPGKKLNFMGNEIGQFREWDEKREQDWDLLKYPKHDEFFRYIKKLNRIYLKYPALYAHDYEQEGFQWLECDSIETLTYAFERRAGGQRILAVFNFSDNDLKHRVHIENCRKVKLLIASDLKMRNEISSKMGDFDILLPRYSGRLYLIEQ
ncbi:MAG: 1,4-alpha-glucan branching protein GlgB [bacterium]|nr:1,4-alpha-glucan branching protein GlgB [bacterium]